MGVANIPSSKDFHKMGLEYVMSGYNGILELDSAIKEYEDTIDTVEDEDREEYWENARLRLLVASTQIQHGIDFFLKSKILEISPYLLLKNSPDRYPKDDDSGSANFADFMTHDAVALPRIINKFSETPLSKEFLDTYEETRKRRNKIIHTYDKSLTLEAKEVIKESIKLVVYISNKSWPDLRMIHTSDDPISTLWSIQHDQYIWKLLKEFEYIQEEFDSDFFEEVYGVPSDTDLYLCKTCVHADFTDEIQTCIEIDDEGSLAIECLLCNETSKCVRDKCDDCGDILVNEEYGECASCGKYN